MSCLLRAKLEAVRRCREALGSNTREEELGYCFRRVLLDLYYDLCIRGGE